MCPIPKETAMPSVERETYKGTASDTKGIPPILHWYLLLNFMVIEGVDLPLAYMHVSMGLCNISCSKLAGDRKKQENMKLH